MQQQTSNSGLTLVESMKQPQFWIDALGVAITVLSAVRVGFTLVDQIKFLPVAQMTQLPDPNVIEGVAKVVEGTTQQL